MRAVIHPGIARGEMPAPPSKSMAHRLLLGAALARGSSRVYPLDASEDLLATIDCLRALGAELRWDGNAVCVQGCDPFGAGSHRFCCRESGSTLRFLIPLCLLSGQTMILTGSERLMARPLSVYADLCREKGMRFEKNGQGLTVQGPLAPGEYMLPGNISSQFITGLLFALPLVPGDSTLRLIPPVESRPYIHMTLQALRAFHIQAGWQDEHTLRVPGGQAYAPGDRAVEGSYSGAAYFEALGCLGGQVRITGLPLNSAQGDQAYRTFFPRLMEGRAEMDVRDCPDLAPVLMALAGALHGCTLTGTRRLRLKESDRGHAMARELAKFGIRAQVDENEIRVEPGELHAPREALCSHNDHRIAMALAVLCTRTGGVIDGAEAVRKSLPDFFARLQALGIQTEITENGGNPA